MAESAVSLVIEQLVPLLTNEADLLTGIHKEVGDIKHELESILVFLRDADMKIELDNANSGLKLWVKRVRELAFQIEDVTDEYVLHVGKHPDHQHGCLQKVVSSFKTLRQRHRIASIVKDLKNSVRLENERGKTYNLCPSEQARINDNTWHDPRVASLFIEEAELVGIETPKNELVSILVEGAGTQNMVISLVGMGGLGKSTLAKKAIEHQRVSAHFNCVAWITVSQRYSRLQLLREMIKKFRSSAKEPALVGIDSMDEFSLISLLREYLSEKRYAVVFDDVWDANFWEYMTCVLGNNENGSRIIITTRNENVAPSPKVSSYYLINEVQPLSNEDALTLFYKKVFQFNEGHCPQELLELSTTIVERCHGLPLAIVAIGGLLATKDKKISEWKRFYDQRFSNIARILSEFP